MSVPNQKTITIHQSEQVPFLKIGIEELFEAYQHIKTPSSFVLYLYLASNKDGYRLELSKEAFANATKLSKSSYHRAVDHLTELGYIYEDNGCLNFATVPKVGKKGVVQSWEKDDSKMNLTIVKDAIVESQKYNISYSEMNTEINNKETIDMKDKKDIPSSSEDFSYLDKIIGGDGSYEWNGESRFLDGNDDPQFYTRPKEYQLKRMMEINPFTEKELIYIMDNILEN